MIVCAYISDRGDTHLPMLRASMAEHLVGTFAVSKIVDDRDHLLGLAGAVRAAWTWALDLGADYLWHQEEDWRYERYVNVRSIRVVLERNPQLAQIILRRGIEYGNQHEIDAGGWMEANPSVYTERQTGDHRWCEHREIFSLNPCLIPRRILQMGWDDDNERGFTQRCLDAGYTFGVWGPLEGPPHITHTGAVRGNGWRP